MVFAQTTPTRWLIRFPQRQMSFTGHGPAPTRFAWLYLPAALAGKPLPRRLHFERKPDGGWRLENTRTGETLEGFFAVSSFLKRWWWALLLVAVGLGLWRLRFDVDILDLLPPDEPTVQGLKLYQQHFTNARELIITLRAPDAEQAERLAGELAARLRQQTNLVAEVTWQPPWMEHPEQLGELLGWLWFNQPPEDFAALTNRLAPDQLKPALDQTKEVLATSMSPMDLARRAFDPFDLLTMPALTNLSRLLHGPGPADVRLGRRKIPLVVRAIRRGPGQLPLVRKLVEGDPRGGGRHLRAGRTRSEDWNGVVVRYTGRPVFVEEIATSMQHDMSRSVGGTSVIIALLFWLTHRRWLPMLWLLALLVLILGATLALGGLVLGTISVVSMGFAAVLLGLAVDYAVVHYQEALAHPQMTVPEIRRAIAPSILWAAITTMSAFLVLNLGGLPGLGQLGTLVAIGIAPVGAGDGDDLSAAAVSRTPQTASESTAVPLVELFRRAAASRRLAVLQHRHEQVSRHRARAAVDRFDSARRVRRAVFSPAGAGPDRQRPATAARRGGDGAGRNHVGTGPAAAAALADHFRPG